MNLFWILIRFIIGISLVAAMFIVGPLLLLWSLNTLFPLLAIPYTWQTWAAAFVLSAPFTGGAFTRFKRSK